VLVDGGDPQETVRVKDLVGYVDGQTTNPTLISKNPEVRTLVSSGRKFSSQEELDEYKKIVRHAARCGAGIHRVCRLDTTAGNARPGTGNVFLIPMPIKYPCTHEGLRGPNVRA
jgi:transaldolase